MNAVRTIMALLTIMATIACIHRPVQPQIEGVTLDVPPECLTKPIIIEHCDPTSEPPKCKGPTHVHYKSGCEQVQVTQK